MSHVACDPPYNLGKAIPALAAGIKPFKTKIATFFAGAFLAQAGFILAVLGEDGWPYASELIDAAMRNFGT
jgi:ABC-type uncharacterized transport system permease subunit